LHCFWVQNSVFQVIIFLGRRKNNQDLERWLKEGIIDGEYNFQLYKNGDQYTSFVDEYERNMTKAKESLNLNTSGELPSLSVSLGYNAGGYQLSKKNILEQVNYIINRKPKEGEDFPVLNSENILGFDYGNLVTNEPPDQPKKLHEVKNY
jgi:regulatory protein YycI of two-component signal transduction system YycFG